MFAFLRPAVKKTWVDSRLIIWDLETGLLRFLRPLSTPDRPLTGRLAFNLDGSRLCAFGAQQSAMIFDTQSLAALDQQAVVAGSGGVALDWSPRDRVLLLIADDFGRYAATSLGGRVPPNWASARLHPAPVRAMKESPDGRRILSLEQGGRLRFLESEFLIEMHDIEHPLGWDADIALDSTARRLAWASRDGQIEIRETEASGRGDQTVQPSTVQDDRNRWETTILVQPTSALLHVNERTIAVDGQGRVNVAYTIGSRDDYRQDGELHFLRVEPEGLRVERLAAGNSVADRRVEPEAFSLGWQPSGNPCVAYRRRTEEKSPYDGDLLLATRMPSGDWHYETIAPSGNWGFTPALVWDDAGNNHRRRSRKSERTEFLVRVRRREPPTADRVWEHGSSGRLVGARTRPRQVEPVRVVAVVALKVGAWLLRKYDGLPIRLTGKRWRRLDRFAGGEAFAWTLGIAEMDIFPQNTLCEFSQ